MAEFLENLGNHILTPKERKLAVSTVAWPLLVELNSTKSAEDKFREENQMLFACVKQLEHKLNLLVGQYAQQEVGGHTLN